MVNSYLEFNLFTEDECKLILQNMNELQFVNFTVKLEDKFYPNGSSMQSQDLSYDESTKWIYDRFTNKVAEQLDVQWMNNPHGVFRNYKVGDYFVEHTDKVDKEGAEMRYFSATIQLSNPSEYSGGELIIDRKHTINKEIGSVTLWGTNLIHEVKTITKGSRNSLVFFAGESHLKPNTK